MLWLWAIFLIRTHLCRLQKFLEIVLLDLVLAFQCDWQSDPFVGCLFRNVGFPVRYTLLLYCLIVSYVNIKFNWICNLSWKMPEYSEYPNKTIRAVGETEHCYICRTTSSCRWNLFGMIRTWNAWEYIKLLTFVILGRFHPRTYSVSSFWIACSLNTGDWKPK